MRGGKVQQIGSPQTLYDTPADLFVAGFIGSPANPGEVGGGAVPHVAGRTVAHRRATQRAGGRRRPRELIVGIRPEHSEDAALVEDHKKQHGSVFTAGVDVLESMGSDKFAYFAIEGDQAISDDLADLAADAGTADVPGGNSGTLVTRLSAASTVAEGHRTEVWVDTSKIQVFDPSNGPNLTTRTATSVPA